MTEKDPLEELKPIAPDEGPPLPRIFNIRWPKFIRERLEKPGNKELDRFIKDVTKGTRWTPFS